MHDELHWVDVPDRVFFKLAVTVHRCLNGRATPYLSDYCVPVAGAGTWRHLRSANRQLLAVLRHWLNTYGCRAFSVAGPTVWNSAGFYPGPHHQCRLFQTFTENVFVRSILVHSARLRFSTITALYKSTYLLTYLRQTDGTAIAYSEREREFTFAKNEEITLQLPNLCIPEL